MFLLLILKFFQQFIVQNTGSFRIKIDHNIVFKKKNA
jgi:hypothetical protein